MTNLLQMIGIFGANLPDRLFPALEEDLGPLSRLHEQFVAALALLQLEGTVEVRTGRGRPGHDRAMIARAFVAKAIFQLPTTRALLDRLSCDRVLRGLCGWESAAAVPDESIFSRAFAGFASSQFPQRVHAAVIQRNCSERLIGHLSRDSSAIEAREKAAPKAAPVVPAPKSRPNRSGKPKPVEKMTRVERQCSVMTLGQMVAELPQGCDWGRKNNSKGKHVSWLGYKLHLDVIDGQIPISGLLTSASVHDSQVAVPLALMSAERVCNCYDLMDSAYDSWQLHEHSRGLGHVPIIDPQPRGAEPVVLAPHEKQRYRERTTIERVFSRLKDEFGGRFVRVRGAAKVMAHLMFGILALTADQLLRMGGVQFTDLAEATR
jgi:Transposase DDE domain/Transposase domain (DUF772)